MSSKKKTKKTDGIRHYEGVDTSVLPKGDDVDEAAMIGVGRSKIRITTMLDTDVLDALKEKASSEGDGRYQTYLNQLLREVLINKSLLDEEAIAEVVRNLVKSSSLKKQA